MKDDDRAFNIIQMKILRVLYQYRYLMTAYEVAKECKISYPTAKKYLKEFSDRGIVLYVDTGEKNYPGKYSFNYGLLKEIKDKKE